MLGMTKKQLATVFTISSLVLGVFERVCGWISGATAGDISTAFAIVRERYSSLPLLGAPWFQAASIIVGLLSLVTLLVLWFTTISIKSGFSSASPQLLAIPVPADSSLELAKRKLTELADECPMKATKKSRPEAWRDRVDAAVRAWLGNSEGDQFLKECNWSADAEIRDVRRMLGRGKSWLDAKTAMLTSESLVLRDSGLLSDLIDRFRRLTVSKKREVVILTLLWTLLLTFVGYRGGTYLKSQWQNEAVVTAFSMQKAQPSVPQLNGKGITGVSADRSVQPVTPPGTTASTAHRVLKPVAPPVRKLLSKSVSPEEIINEISDSQDFAKEATRQKYIGAEVTWTCRLYKTERVNTEQVNVHLSYSWSQSSKGYVHNPNMGSSGSTSVAASVLSWEYPGIEMLSPDTSVQINGLIDQIMGSSGFRLRGVRLQFEP
jgi:hypothetical protein